MCIIIGRPAPALGAQAWVRGTDAPVEVDVPGNAGDWTVLAFYPADFAFVCPTELRAFGELQDDFRATAFGLSCRA
jgi:alkyl hydroperoxide reductase subunit AhpC